MRKALHARHLIHDPQGEPSLFHCLCCLFIVESMSMHTGDRYPLVVLPGSADGGLPYSDILNVVLERHLAESKEWFSADISPASRKQDFDWDEYFRVWEFAETVRNSAAVVCCVKYDMI